MIFNHQKADFRYIKAVIKQMKSVFSEHGLPQELISDNAPCCASEEFNKFMVQYGIKHIKTSLHFHKSYGLVEKYVGIIKDNIKKVKYPW